MVERAGRDARGAGDGVGAGGGVAGGAEDLGGGFEQLGDTAFTAGLAAARRLLLLRGAGLRGAGLRGAVLRGAGLRGAVLRGAGLRGAVLLCGLRGAVLLCGVGHALSPALRTRLTNASGRSHSDETRAISRVCQSRQWLDHAAVRAHVSAGHGEGDTAR
ncbi:pentapeptide repeat-containing protein [Streptomyces olivaceoviridis]